MGGYAWSVVLFTIRCRPIMGLGPITSIQVASKMLISMRKRRLLKLDVIFMKVILCGESLLSPEAEYEFKTTSETCLLSHQRMERVTAQLPSSVRSSI